ncbi:hypothetical protein F5050DRAFT_1800809 [Lentinula boryana]|uniref:Uncharacterized protein n=1 Tax=Lentinula boryana TaxID=40481 RepID=A0ABQ8Q6V2_9AGAR|nr:hypothetical protein F5050DRAFT_1800809 [Lentinula boryana]
MIQCRNKSTGSEPKSSIMRPVAKERTPWTRSQLIDIKIMQNSKFAKKRRQLLNNTDISTHISFQALLADAVYLDEFGVNGGELEEINEPDEDEDDNGSNINLEAAQNEEYFPYPDKISMLLDILDNLPRLRLSTHSVKLILWMLKELGHNVPSLNKFRAMQKSLRSECASVPQAHVSDFKNHYHSIPLQESIAKDFSNPQTAPHINLYPERTDGPRSEAWQFDRWIEFSPSQLTPMYSQGSKQFWIEEVAQLSDGTLVIPRNWVYITQKQRRELHSDCSVIDITPVIPASKFMYNYDDVIARTGDSFPWHESTSNISRMPNPLRDLAEGDDLYVVMVPLWCDDVSGNKSKQYNKHINIYSVNGSLPGQLLQQEYFVNFVSTSPHATALEQFKSLRDEIRETERKPIRVYNAATGRMCRSILRVPMLPADNPAQSEESSHMGGNSNHPCQKCKVGGSFQETETADGYHCFFCDNESIWRSAEEIKTELSKQLEVAKSGVQARVSELQTESGIKDKITEVWIEKLIIQARAYKAQKLPEAEISARLTDWIEKEPGEKMNPLLDITGLDPSQDTPVEILHTVLLGIMKYIWYMSHTAMTDKELELLAVRLQSTDTDGLTVPPLRAAYMIQYCNNLIGKHFKTLMQILPFHVHSFLKLGLTHFKLVQMVGALGPLLWTSEIDELEQYLDDVDVLVGNVLDAFADVAPSKILLKIKIHLLTHLRNDIRQFGPPIRYATEIFEAFNAVFRLCSIYSNHQAPSRNIAIQFSDMGRVKHILSGGYWPRSKSHGNVQWVQASKTVLSLLANAGRVAFRSRKKAVKVSWSQTTAAVACTKHSPSDIDWFSGDICTIGSWAIVQEENDKQAIGRISEILLRGNLRASHGVVTLKRFQLGADIHEDFKCPILRRQIPQSYVAVASTAVKFRFSAQHDCRLANCQPTRHTRQIQERQVTERTQLLLQHSDDDNFVVNMYALHNAMLLCQALPRELSQPIALYKVARILVVEQAKKRAHTQEKTQATRKRKKEEAEKLTQDGTVTKGPTAQPTARPQPQKKQRN